MFTPPLAPLWGWGLVGWYLVFRKRVGKERKRGESSKGRVSPGKDTMELKQSMNTVSMY